MKLKSINEEAAACREAFKNSKVGDPVWLCHHEILAELLTEEPEARILYILKEKPENERALRLRLFRPIDVSALPEDLKTALGEFLKAQDYSDKARVEFFNMRAGTWLDYYSSQDEYRQAMDKRDRARDEFRKLLTPHYHTLFPDSPWNGETIFPQE